MADVLTTEVLIWFSAAAVEEVTAATSIAKKRRSGRR
jgi:hypothetical protein